jgi:integrase
LCRCERAYEDGTLAPWTLHDLRHTMVTLMNERLGIPPYVVEAVVNHVSGSAKAGVAGVYNRALYLDERQKALNRRSDTVERITRRSKSPMPSHQGIACALP